MDVRSNSFSDSNKEELEAFRILILPELWCISSLTVDKNRNLLSIKYVSKRMELRDLREKKMLSRR